MTEAAGRRMRNPKAGSTPPSRGVSFTTAAALGGPPLLLGLGSLLHPTFTTDAAISAQRIAGDPTWLAAHLILWAGVVLFDLSLLGWPGAAGGLGRLRAAGVVLNLSCYPVFVGIDGFAGWIAVHTPSSGAASGPVVAALFSNPLVAAFDWAGGLGWVIAALSLMAEHYRRSRRLIAPPLPLLIGAVWLGVSHAPPIGVVGALFAAGAGAWEGLSRAAGLNS